MQISYQGLKADVLSIGPSSAQNLSFKTLDGGQIFQYQLSW